jgi:hypothetical protein
MIRRVPDSIALAAARSTTPRNVVALTGTFRVNDATLRKAAEGEPKTASHRIGPLGAAIL